MSAAKRGILDQSLQDLLHRLRQMRQGLPAKRDYLGQQPGLRQRRPLHLLPEVRGSLPDQGHDHHAAQQETA